MCTSMRGVSIYHGCLSHSTPRVRKLSSDYHFGARDNQSGVDSESSKAILSTMRNGRTWVKLSGPYLSDELDHRELSSRLLAEAGPTRLLWGSDWPFVKLNGQLHYSQAVDWLARSATPEEASRQQIDANALELYRFPRPS